jgi:hypothetical protein
VYWKFNHNISYKVTSSHMHHENSIKSLNKWFIVFSNRTISDFPERHKTRRVQYSGKLVVWYVFTMKIVCVIVCVCVHESHFLNLILFDCNQMIDHFST